MYRCLLSLGMLLGKREWYVGGPLRCTEVFGAPLRKRVGGVCHQSGPVQTATLLPKWFGNAVPERMHTSHGRGTHGTRAPSFAVELHGGPELALPHAMTASSQDSSLQCKTTEPLGKSKADCSALSWLRACVGHRLVSARCLQPSTMGVEVIGLWRRNIPVYLILNSPA